MELFTVETITPEYCDCRDVTFSWFYEGARTTRRPYERLIENYDPGREHGAYSEGCIDELFTSIEAAALKSYLDREHGDDGVTIIKPAKLPIPNNVMGFGAMAVGGGDDFYMLSEEQGYSLPFKVWGYFNLADCELTDGSGVYRHRPWLVFPNAVAMLADDEIPF